MTYFIAQLIKEYLYGIQPPNCKHLCKDVNNCKHL